MATSLAKQLKKLQLPGQSLDKVTSKASFLFTAKEAAGIDTDTIYSIGLNGLEELTSLDPQFSQYRHSLFSESCKHFERTVEDPTIVKQLDVTIVTFLRHLSPYFLLRPAHKCMEWLIRIFRIHQCNINAIMECILPYYETNLFARLVQLLDIKQDHASDWFWLHPIHKEGTPLSRLTLIQHCLSDLSFLVFVCNMVPSSLSCCHDDQAKAGGTFRVLISFYCSTLTGVIERGPISEGVVSRLLPFILKGLKSSHDDYRASSYMITSLLATKVKLDIKVTTSLMNSILKVRFIIYCQHVHV